MIDRKQLEAEFATASEERRKEMYTELLDQFDQAIEQGKKATDDAYRLKQAEELFEKGLEK